jgi:uncharacterized membrane protein
MGVFLEIGFWVLFFIFFIIFIFILGVGIELKKKKKTCLVAGYSRWSKLGVGANTIEQ